MLTGINILVIGKTTKSQVLVNIIGKMVIFTQVSILMTKFLDEGLFFGGKIVNGLVINTLVTGELVEE